MLAPLTTRWCCSQWPQCFRSARVGIHQWRHGGPCHDEPLPDEKRKYVQDPHLFWSCSLKPVWCRVRFHTEFKKKKKIKKVVMLIQELHWDLHLSLFTPVWVTNSGMRLFAAVLCCEDLHVNNKNVAYIWPLLCLAKWSDIGTLLCQYIILIRLSGTAEVKLEAMFTFCKYLYSLVVLTLVEVTPVTVFGLRQMEIFTRM